MRNKWHTRSTDYRKHRVSENGGLSRLAEVLSGILQISVFGQLLFIQFVNDTPEAVHGYIQMFADDTKVYREMCSATDQHHLQANLDALERWSNEWLLRFSVDKCKVIHIG